MGYVDIELPNVGLQEKQDDGGEAYPVERRKKYDVGVKSPIYDTYGLCGMDHANNKTEAGKYYVQKKR